MIPLFLYVCLLDCMCKNHGFTSTGPEFQAGAKTAERKCLEWKLENAQPYCESTEHYQQHCQQGAHGKPAWLNVRKLNNE